MTVHAAAQDWSVGTSGSVLRVFGLCMTPVTAQVTLGELTAWHDKATLFVAVLGMAFASTEVNDAAIAVNTT